LARTYNKDGKFEWFDNRAFRNTIRPVDGIWDGIPFKSKFGVLRNGTHKINDPVYIYPNGMASWYWAPFAHKIVQEKGTPVMMFNAAFPGSSVVKGWHPTNQAGDNGN
jgi:hypothetical protein